jgi:hypothetical protein
MLDPMGPENSIKSPRVTRTLRRHFSLDAEK